MLRALTVLLLCQLAGEAVTRLLQLPVPGPVTGLVILAILLMVLPMRLQGIVDLDPAANGILAALGLLFIPAGVGVIQQLGLLGTFWLGILATLFVSTIVTMLVTVGTFLAVKKFMLRSI